MSITDELRKWGYGFCGDTHDVVTAIADRIDAEHEECTGFCRRLEDAAKEGAEVTIFGTDYIPLPKDADGVTIRIGDELEFCNGGKVRRGKVQAISDCWVSFGEGPFYGVKSCRHTKPDTWERIIEDAQADGVRYQIDGRPSDFDALVERCKRLCEQERANEV